MGGLYNRSNQRYGLWTGGEHFGDWLGLDAPWEVIKAHKGGFHCFCILRVLYKLVVKAGKCLAGMYPLMKAYIKKLDTFRKTYPVIIPDRIYPCHLVQTSGKSSKVRR